MKAVYAAGTDYDNPLSQLKVGGAGHARNQAVLEYHHVAAASVNHHDIWSLQGVGLSAEQTPMILGTDASGVLDEDIPVRKGLKAGAEVVLYTFVGTDGAGVMPGGAAHHPIRKIRGHHGRNHPSAQRQRVRQTRQPDPR